MSKKQKAKKSIKISLPVSRFKQFAFIYRTNPLLTLKLSLLCSLFLLPLISQAILFLIYLGPTLQAAGETSTIIKNLFNLIRIFSLFFLISIPIASLGISTIVYILKRVIYNDGFVLKRDFMLGFKQAWRNFLIVLIYSILLTALFFGVFLIDISNNLTLFLVLSILALILTIIIINMMMHSITINTFYKVTIIENIKDSFIITFNSLLSSTGLLLLALAPFIVLYTIDVTTFSRLTFLSLIGVIYIIFIGSGNGALMYVLNDVRIFDKTINRLHFEEIFELGLYKGEDDDE